MQVTQIASCRSYESWLSYDLIFEWEDILAQHLAIPIVNIDLPKRTGILSRFRYHRYGRKLSSLLQKPPLKIFYNSFSHLQRSPNQYSLIFDLAVNYHPSRADRHDIIPVIVDFWKNTSLDDFYTYYRNCKVVLISSLEAYSYLLKVGCPLPVAHYPLSLPDYYRFSDTTLYQKQYDIILAGRTNDVLLGYVELYSAKYPQVEILSRITLEEEFYYTSNVQGLIGKVHTRTEYIALLQASRIALYSTPGMDDGVARSGGFNPVTPRYLEMLSAQCLLLGRYPDNEETAFYEVASVCPHINSYEEFEQTINEYLQLATAPLATYQAILEKHYTSCRASQLQAILDRY